MKKSYLGYKKTSCLGNKKKSYLGFYFDYTSAKKYSQHIITKEYTVMLNNITNLQDSISIQPTIEAQVYFCLKLPSFKRHYSIVEKGYYLIFEIDNILYESIDDYYNKKSSEKHFIKPKSNDFHPYIEQYFIKPISKNFHPCVDQELLNQCYVKTEEYFTNILPFVYSTFLSFYEDYKNLPSVRYINNQYLIPLKTFEATSKRISQTDVNTYLNHFREMLLLVPKKTSNYATPIYSLLSYFDMSKQFLFFIPTYAQVSYKRKWVYSYQNPSFKKVLEERLNCPYSDFDYPYFYISDYFRFYKEANCLHNQPIYDYTNNTLILEKKPKFISDKILINRTNCTVRYSNCYSFLCRAQFNQTNVVDSTIFDFELDKKIECLKNDCKIIVETEDYYELAFKTLLPEEIHRIVNGLYFSDVADYQRIIEKIVSN